MKVLPVGTNKFFHLLVIMTVNCAKAAIYLYQYYINFALGDSLLQPFNGLNQPMDWLILF